jgi:hypothetical protein
VASRSDRGDIENGLSFEVGRDFGLGHRDGRALICHMASDPSSPSPSPILLGAIHPRKRGSISPTLEPCQHLGILTTENGGFSRPIGGVGSGEGSTVSLRYR